MEEYLKIQTMYGIPESIEAKGKAYLEKDMIEVIERFNSIINS